MIKRKVAEPVEAETETIRLHHRKLKDCYVMMERSQEQDGDFGSWYMVAAYWPDGREADPIKTLNEHGLHVEGWRTDEPFISLQDNGPAKPDARPARTRRSRFTGRAIVKPEDIPTRGTAVPGPRHKSVPAAPLELDFSFGGHNSMDTLKKGRWSPAEAVERVKTRGQVKKSRREMLPYERQGFVLTGETRCPRKGEWFVGFSNGARQATIDFEDRVFAILEPEQQIDLSL